MPVIHYSNDSAATEWLLMSADLCHCDSDISLQLIDGKFVVAGVVTVDSWQSARELLTEDAA